MPLLERYLDAVGRHLPPDKEADIRRHLAMGPRPPEATGVDVARATRRSAVRGFRLEPQYPAKSSVRTSSPLTPAFTSTSRMAATIRGGPAA